VDRELVEKWVAALESGKYKRGSGALHFVQNGEHRFCCLGVLADIVNPDGWVTAAGGKVIIDFKDGYVLYPLEEEGYGYLDPYNCQFLEGDEPWQPDQKIQDTLSVLNDDAPNDDTSYEAVIPWIKQNLL
jgi:hypothetical protein